MLGIVMYLQEVAIGVTYGFGLLIWVLAAMIAVTPKVKKSIGFYSHRWVLVLVAIICVLAWFGPNKLLGM